MKRINVILTVVVLSMFLISSQLEAGESGGMHKMMTPDAGSNPNYSVGHGKMDGQGFKGHDKDHFRRHGKKNSNKGHRLFRGRFLTPELAKALKLDEEQIEKIKGVESSYMKTLIRSEADLKIAEIELKELISAKQVNLDEVKEKTSLIGSLSSGLRFFRYKTMEDVKNILKDEQKEQFRKLFGKYISGSKFTE